MRFQRTVMLLCCVQCRFKLKALEDNRIVTASIVRFICTAMLLWFQRTVIFMRFQRTVVMLGRLLVKFRVY